MLAAHPFWRRLLYGFGIVLLLAVLFILFVPCTCNIYMPADKTAAQSNLAQIAKTYVSYTFSGNILDGPPKRNIQLPPGSTVHDAAFILAQQADLNDASLYFTMKDARAPKVIPRSVIAGDLRTATGVASDFARATLGLVMAANIALDAPPSTTPYCWTRGLQPDGTWSKDSPWQGKGGHIAYLDGHVEWQNKLDAKDPSASLLKYGTSIPTANIAEALPPGAIILPAEPRPAAK